MSKFYDRIMAKDEQENKEKVRKEKLSGFFYNIALASFSVLVLGVVVSFYQDAEIRGGGTYMVAVGFFVTYMSAWIGNKLLK